ncbi:hypothetical protein [Paenibacillus apis]|uniref:Uncharacterized protein n=1 Tax=Paenibacillus apis TaxID=1792174 RepID=A0A920CJ93_9BACL|nr:hypothetical protein [Paenibacillus apis]GIO42506.1 hypothetical protein J41TS4_22640 [Paenibacillus apis]
MLGKASEIKIATISGAADRFEESLRDWCEFNPKAMIEDIKFTATALENQVDYLHALIIYKEAPHE